MEEQKSENVIKEVSSVTISSGASLSNRRKLFLVGGSLIGLGLIVWVGFRGVQNQPTALSSLFLGSAKTTSESVSPVCQKEYESLLETHRMRTPLCEEMAFRSEGFQDAGIESTPINVVMIFDASGSMAAQIGGETKMEIAKRATSKFLGTLTDPRIQLSVVVYGHKGSNAARDRALSCAGIEEVYWLGKVDSTLARSKFQSLAPTGWTPIAQSLQKAQDILKKASTGKEHNLVLLISDGEETCGGDPVATTKSIKQSGLDVTINVIGYDVGGTTEDQLRAIATAGDGIYTSVKNEKDFDAIFQQQENMLKRMDYAVRRSIEQLYDISSSVLKYNQCLMALNIEEAGVMLNLGEKTSPTCQSLVETEYTKRYDTAKQTLDKTFEHEKGAFQEIVNAKQ